jgi:ABC-type transport system involved in cytochrome bd biosynthesis fused ATPase/permease subunit
LARLRQAAGNSSPLDVRVDALSIGERQRVALARILLRDAPIVLLDEPDANLDAAGVDLVRTVVRELAQSRTVAVAAHTESLTAAADVVLRLS